MLDFLLLSSDEQGDQKKLQHTIFLFSKVQRAGGQPFRFAAVVGGSKDMRWYFCTNTYITNMYQLRYKYK